MLIFKINFQRSYPPPTPKYGINASLGLSFLLKEVASLFESSIVDFSVFRSKILSKSEPVYAYRR